MTKIRIVAEIDDDIFDELCSYPQDRVQKHGKNIAKGAVIGLGLVAAFMIGSRAGSGEDDSDVVADSDYVEVDETESDEASEE